MKIIIFILFQIATTCFAADGWFCDTQSSRIDDDKNILVCGKAKSSDETTAKLEAMSNAKKEFKALCENIDWCKGKEFQIDPRRTVCDSHYGKILCTRSFYFSVKDAPLYSILVDQKPSKDQSHAVLKRGLSKDDILKLFGKPDEVYVSDSPYIKSKFRIYTYESSRLCVEMYGRCTIQLSDDVVTKFEDFRREFIDIDAQL